MKIVKMLLVAGVNHIIHYSLIHFWNDIDKKFNFIWKIFEKRAKKTVSTLENHKFKHDIHMKERRKITLSNRFAIFRGFNAEWLIKGGAFSEALLKFARSVVYLTYSSSNVVITRNTIHVLNISQKKNGNLQTFLTFDFLQAFIHIHIHIKWEYWMTIFICHPFCFRFFHSLSQF